MPPRGRGRPARSEVYERLRLAMDDMRARFGGLPSRLEAEAIWRDIWREEVHNSTAIEGNTLVQREVNDLLERGVVTGARRKELSEYLIVKGYANAADWVYEIGISGMKPPSWPLVDAEMKDWLSGVNTLRCDDPYPIKAIAESHAVFERIHPFIDGNGRTGRLLLNLILVRLGMPPAIIYNRERERYLAALARADAGDTGALAELIARAVLNNLHRLMLPKLAGPVRLVPLATLANSEISHGALRSAAARGALKAVQDQLGQWQSSRAHVDEYLAQRGLRRGRPPKSEGPV